MLKNLLTVILTSINIYSDDRPKKRHGEVIDMGKKCFFIAIFIVFLTSCVGSVPLPAPPSPNKDQFALVILSSYGKIQQTPAGVFQLIFNESSIENVVAFSNRPYRIIKTATAKSLVNSLSEGLKPSPAGPPNASVIINQQIQTVMLLDVVVNGGEVIFTVKADGSQSLIPSSGRTSMFIDWCISNFCMPCGCSDPSCNSPNSCD